MLFKQIFEEDAAKVCNLKHSDDLHDLLRSKKVNDQSKCYSFSGGPVMTYSTYLRAEVSNAILGTSGTSP